MDREAYQGARAFSITIATWERDRVFTDASEVARSRDVLGAAAKQEGFRLLAYCFMPDHLHLLVEGSDDSDLARFVKAFKQKKSFHHNRSTGRPLWQRSYHDHMLRSGDEVLPAVRYILDNPVVAGLVIDAARYPFLGGEVIEGELVAT
jgi:putative transposase